MYIYADSWSVMYTETIEGLTEIHAYIFMHTEMRNLKIKENFKPGSLLFHLKITSSVVQPSAHNNYTFSNVLNVT